MKPKKDHPWRKSKDAAEMRTKIRVEARLDGKSTLRVKDILKDKALDSSWTEAWDYFADLGREE